MKVLAQAIVLAFILLGLSYFVNNQGQCCDQIFSAGWPIPFYGGSGGFAGILEDKIIWIGLLKSLGFWLITSYLIIFLMQKVRTVVAKK